MKAVGKKTELIKGYETIEGYRESEEGRNCE
jgi:hypothetical protein